MALVYSQMMYKVADVEMVYNLVNKVVEVHTSKEVDISREMLAIYKGKKNACSLKVLMAWTHNQMTKGMVYIWVLELLGYNLGMLV